MKAKGLIMTALLLGTVGFAGAQSAAADVRDPGVNVRQRRQALRIEQGVRSGQLTRAETRRLTRQQTRIRRAERRCRADGCLSLRERARLHAMQNRAGRHIHRAKHNRRHAPQS